MGYVEVLNLPLAKKVDYLVNTFGVNILVVFSCITLYEKCGTI